MAQHREAFRVATDHSPPRRVCDEPSLSVPKISLNEAGIGETGEMASFASY